MKAQRLLAFVILVISTACGGAATRRAAPAMPEAVSPEGFACGDTTCTTDQYCAPTGCLAVPAECADQPRCECLTARAAATSCREDAVGVWVNQDDQAVQ